MESTDQSFEKTATNFDVRQTLRENLAGRYDMTDNLKNWILNI